MLDKPLKYDYTVESWKGPMHLRPTGGNPTRRLLIRLSGLILPADMLVHLARATTRATHTGKT